MKRFEIVLRVNADSRDEIDTLVEGFEEDLPNEFHYAECKEIDKKLW